MPAPPPKPYVPNRSGLMDFEPVSLEAARAALDELPTGVAAMLDSSYWVKVRRAPLPTDKALTGKTMAWLSDLPADVQPRQTAERYARIVNAIAAVWREAEARDELFEQLLNDRRHGRRGVPIEVERELSALCLHASSLPR
jgi:hypothetical protein